MKKNSKTLMLLLLSLFLLAGCGNQVREDPGMSTSGSEQAAGPVRSLEDLLLSELPAGAVPLDPTLKAAVSPGDSILVTGRIGGVSNPFTEGFALFIMAGEELVFCDEMGDDDHCPMPWDACCEDPVRRSAHRALVQVVDVEGIPLEVSLKGFGGLVENDSIIVSGVVDASSNSEKLVINADGIYRM